MDNMFSNHRSGWSSFVFVLQLIFDSEKKNRLSIEFEDKLRVIESSAVLDIILRVQATEGPAVEKVEYCQTSAFKYRTNANISNYSLISILISHDFNHSKCRLSALAWHEPARLTIPAPWI